MPATVNANEMTVVHAGSSGMAMSFPDVCKTPAPPSPSPIPIPYPNVAQSSDTADGSSTVKVDGNPIMLKSSNFKMSSGDEPGSLFGVVSNKNKGKAQPINASFDVKCDGKPVFRLTDPMQTNCGGSANAMNPAEVQPPNPVIPFKSDDCKKTEDKKKEQEKAGPSTSWGNSGIVESHREPIKRVTGEMQVVAYFRQTKAECGKWIEAFHQPKPHSCMSGTTIVARKGHLPKVKKWLEENDRRVPQPKVVSLDTSNRFYGVQAEPFEGIVGNPVGNEMIEPLRGSGRQVADYSNKWMTGDYDLFEVLKGKGKCKKVSGWWSFGSFKRKINKALKWDAIQHPPQAQWRPKKKELGGLPLFDMNKEVKDVLGGKKDKKASVPFAKGRDEMKIIDSPLTAVCGDTVVTLEDDQAVIDALNCKQCGE